MSNPLKSWATSQAKRVLRMPPGPRRYLLPGTTVEQFFLALNAANAQYVVLRWFDSLPKVEKGEDIDLLVADASLPIIEKLTRAYPLLPTTQKLDIYTVSGLPGTNFHAMPYLTPKLAARVVTGSVVHKNVYRVPAPVDHFDSMAFHAVYHKGFASGLPEHTGEAPKVPRPDHDYLGVLSALASTNQTSVDVSLTGLDDYLRAHGLRPASDTLERFQSVNAWLEGELDRTRPAIGDLAGLVVYVVRDKGEDFRDEIVAALDRQGLEILTVFSLTPRQRELATAAIRGGNWGPGPFKMSGGRPSSMIVAYDFAVGNDKSIVNERAAVAKRVARELVAAHVGSPDAFNPLHSTDNGWQSLEYLRDLDEPKIVVEITGMVAALMDTVRSPWPVVRVLASYGRRARVDVVDHPVHGECVIKLFRPGAVASCEREIAARDLVGDSPLVPPLLEAGDNWILSRFYEDTRRHAVRRLPGSREVQLRRSASRALGEFVALMRERGLYMLDLTSHNVITDPIEGMKILDFEFLQAYPGAVPELTLDCSVTGVPGVLGNPGAAPVWPTSTNWHNGVTRSLFRAAVTGLPAAAVERRGGGLRASLVQLAWLVPFAASAVVLRILATRPARRARELAKKVRP